MKVVWQIFNLFADFEEDLLAGETMFVAELAERYPVNMGNPEYRILASMVYGEGMFAGFAEVSFLASSATTLDCC